MTLLVTGSDPLNVLARWRVRLGFLTGMIALWLARPTVLSLVLGGLVAAIGEALRFWAAGHLEKGREVTTSGPYGFVRHPLYLGSAIIASGMAIAGATAGVAVVVLSYLAITVFAAIRTEEAWLRARFGGEYDAYLQSQEPSSGRPFSLSRAMANREYRAIAGLVAVAALLALKL
jgi:protein-S-isoprenylcysteine O-methyltransferase Ste14